MRRRSAVVAVGIALSMITLQAQRCDPQSTGLQILTKQGLTLLRPARDYVRVGGIVVKAGNGRAQYLDPFDPVSEVPGTTVPFRAVILRETRQRTSSLGTVIQGLAAIVPLPVGLTYDAAQEVALSQINASGARLPTAELRRLIGSQDTKKVLFAELQKRQRVFVVQELYATTELEITSHVGNQLNVTYGEKQLQGCSGTQSGTTTPQAKDEQQRSSEQREESASARILACRSSTASVKLQAEAPVPFAVRLAEVGLTVNGDGPEVGVAEIAGAGSIPAEVSKIPEQNTDKRRTITLRLEVKPGAARFDERPVIEGMVRRPRS